MGIGYYSVPKLQAFYALFLLNMFAGFASSQAVAQSSGASTSAAEATAPRNATLAGTVLTDATERPLLNAQITIAKLGLSATSDSSGNFRLARIPAGEYDVAIRLQGFEPLFTLLKFAAGQNIEADFLLKDRIIQRAPQAVTGTSDPDINRSMLQERRVAGTGRFITQDEFSKTEPRPTSQLILGKVPELHANSIGGFARAIAFGRGKPDKERAVQGDAANRKAGAKADCYVQVVLNETVMYQPQAERGLYDVNTIPSHMLMRVEYFAAGQAPPEFNATGSQCGTLLIWTRGR